MPFVNMALMVGVIMLVLAFRNSSNLAHAYGIAVTGTMVVTALLAIVAIHRHWNGRSGNDCTHFAIPSPGSCLSRSNLMKFLEGGYVPILIALGMGIIMWTWIRGTMVLARKDAHGEMRLDTLLHSLEKKELPVISGTAVFLTAHGDHAPVALLHSLKHFKSLHEENVILTVVTANIPRVPVEERVRIEDLGTRFRRVTLTFGYMEEPNIPSAMAYGRKLGWKFDMMSTSFLVSRRSLRPASKSALPHGRAAYSSSSPAIRPQRRTTSIFRREGLSRSGRR